MPTTKTIKTNYSWKTSLPAYFENMEGKELQKKLILFILRKHRNKKATLKEIQDYLRINFKIMIPQSTISGRMGDLRDDNRVAFYGETKIYRSRLRKVFEIIVRGSKKKKTKRRVKIIFEKVRPKSYKIRNGVHILILSNGNTWQSKDGRIWSRKRNKPLGHSLKQRDKK